MLLGGLSGSADSLDVHSEAVEGLLQFCQLVAKKQTALLSHTATATAAVDCAANVLALARNQPQLIKQAALFFSALLSNLHLIADAVQVIITLLTL